MPNMSLERFKEEADEQLKEITMDPAIQARILFRIREEENKARQKPARSPWYFRAGVTFGAAAAALVLMFVTGVLPLPGRTPAANAPVRGDPNTNQAQPISADMIDLPTSDEQLAIEYGVYNLQKFQEGFAAAQNENGFWGFVDETYHWVVEPVYEEVSAVENGTASVRLNGKVERIQVKK